MKILFVIKNYYPYDDGSSNCVKSIAEQLSSSGKEVHILSMKYDFNISDEEIYSNIKIHRMLDKCEIPISDLFINIETSNRIIKITKKIQIIFLKSLRRIEYKFNKNTILYYERKITTNKIKELNKKYKFDVIISVSQPFFTSVSTFKAVKKNKTKFIIYQLDPYSNNLEFEKKYKNNRLKVETKVFSRADKIIVTDLIYSENLQGELKSYSNKMRVLKFPLIKEKIKEVADDDIILSDDYINCAFIGCLYQEIRNPYYLLEIFKNMSCKKIRLIIVGSGMEEMLEEYKKVLKDRLEIYKKVSQKAAFNVMLNADILINLGNTVPNQMPSKILDYISTGKPIINLYKIDDCPTLEYTKDYELALNIKEGQKINKELINKIEKFCNTNKGKYIEFNKIKNKYLECTPKYVSEKFIEIVEK